MAEIRDGRDTTALLQVGSTLSVDATRGVAWVVSIASGVEPGSPVVVNGTTQTFGPFDDLMSYRVIAVSGIVVTTQNDTPARFNRPFRRTTREGQVRGITVPAGSVLRFDASPGSIASIWESGTFSPVTPYVGDALTIGPFSTTRFYRVLVSLGSVTGETEWYSGTPTPTPGRTTASVWTGAAEPNQATVTARSLDPAASEMRLRVVPEGGGDAIISPAVAPDASFRLAKMTCTGLQPDTAYTYAVLVDGVADPLLQGKFRTAPPAGVATSFSFAHSSCSFETTSAHPRNRPYNNRVYGLIEEANPAFFIHHGDLHYRDITTNSEALFQDAYNTILDEPAMASLFAKVPVHYTWDDHDSGGNDSYGGSTSMPAAMAAYRRRVPSAALAQAGASGPIYHSFTRGRVLFVVTDLRSQRSIQSATDNASKTMLGAVQKQWFKDLLTNPDHAQKMFVWVCTVPWIAAAGSSNDSWGGYSTERTELANFITANDIARRMCIVSGDMHATAYDNGVNSPGGFPVFHAGPINSVPSLKGGPYSGGSPIQQDHQYAIMSITDTGGDTISVAWRAYRDGVAGPILSHDFTRQIIAGTDTTAPTITSANPSGTYPEGTIGSTLTANEPVTWSVTGADAASVTLNAATGVWSISATDYTVKSSYNWSFVATDAAGNVSTPQVVAITIADAVTSFSDNFNRADENLEASPNWTRVFGVAGGAAIRSNALATTTTTDTVYVSPDFNTVQHYVEAKSAGAGSGPMLCARATTDGATLLGVRRSSTNTIAVFKKVGTTVTQLYSASSVATGDVLRLAITETQWIVYKNGVEVTRQNHPSDVPAGTRQGIMARVANAVNPWIDDYVAGVLP